MKGPDSLIVKDALTLSTGFLDRKGSPSARLDSQILIAHVLGVRRLDLYLTPDRPLTAPERDRLRELLVRRGKAEPVAYLVGRKEFFGFDFIVNRDVLIPRPETESIVDAALELLNASQTSRMRQVADIGTGSGAIACVLAAKSSDIAVTATDTSAAAIEVAGTNARALGVDHRISFVKTDILRDVIEPESFDLIVSNPPYIALVERDITDAAARDFEPETALFSGPDGTDCTFAIIDAAIPRLAPGGSLILEVGSPRQSELVADRLNDSFGHVNGIKDPGGFLRGYVASEPKTYQSRGKTN